MKVSFSFLVAALQLAAFLPGCSGASYSSYSSSSAYGSNFFVDSSATYYDGYQQAWRYLGWYVKCGYPSDRYEESGDEHDSGEHDEGGGRKLSGDDNRWQGNNYCQRYLMWAAVSRANRSRRFTLFDYVAHSDTLSSRSTVRR